ncbi:hydroxymethylglutaryl-CoA lyase [Terrimonas sp.]|uniref:hydroxymethylglutaryl-CoA lyase n=1 Tax=Terrimonas sp. TaxID=1914338 RepID=UPI000D518934|nr:hydroxymethylglutaryl-CoA lyase [Terrimonas sp.]PVD52353.1 hydroxymethylglutaryl-CoA lyase [Terrimonas sp.]
MKPGKSAIRLIECPRDAMQGWSHFIPTEDKVKYINTLLKVGFDTIDFGSFVSAKAIPQMADTHEVTDKLDISNSKTKLLAIIANERGADEAFKHDIISLIGFPFSVSETFQLRNTNSTIADSLHRVANIQERCVAIGKQLVIYISMGFGNPYDDVYNEDIVLHWIEKITALGIKIVSLADTVGLATPEQVFSVTKSVIEKFPGIETGVHLHSTPFNRIAKIDAAFKAGCTRFDGALMGIGGCPMADDDLVGNMDTEQLISYFSNAGKPLQLDQQALQESITIAQSIFR